MKLLPDSDPTFQDFSVLYLSATGSFVEPGKDLDGLTDGVPVSPDTLPSFLKRRIVLPAGVTDVFVWVHGWQNDQPTGIANCRRMFKAILSGASSDASRYPALRPFRPAFVGVRWPSMSSAGRKGYKRIRDRAAALTDNGDAEFFLASLLGYLETQNVRSGGAGTRTLRARGGFYVHCLGHSFGGRFLTAAVRAAAEPTPRTLSLLDRAGSPARKVLGAAGAARFAFTVDSMLIFQMAAPSSGFAAQLRRLATDAPLLGPLVLTYSSEDRANCLWHRLTEGEPAIGCSGALEPSELIDEINFRGLADTYEAKDFKKPIVNVRASDAFVMKKGKFEGAHSDFWYEESIHLVLSLAAIARSPATL